MDDAAFRPKLGVSSCLVGNAVRYNGEHKRHDWLTSSLLPHVDPVVICPEVSMGLGVPRPAMRLVRGEGGPRLQAITSGEDLTELARATAKKLVAALPADLDGYVLMPKSPSCGQERVKVYGRNNIPQHDGVGIFAAELLKQRPWVVVVEAGRLADLPQREHFVLRLFAMARLARLERTPRALQEFHRSYKFLILAHGRKHLEALGQLVAGARAESIEADFARYRDRLHAAFSKLWQTRHMVDALTHMYGFVKNDVEPAQGQAIRAAIDDFGAGRSPLLVPLSMIGFGNLQAGNAYLAEQAIFAPYPEAKIGRKHGG